MLSMHSIVTTKINDREYQLSFAPDSPIDDILEANSQINAFVLGRKVQQQAALKSSEEQLKSE